MFLAFKSFSQEVDLKKVEKISSILCDCLKLNKEKSDTIRVDECSQALIDGLSVVKNESLKNAYAQKSDTYLQRKCLEYARITLNSFPASDVELVSKSIFDKYNRNALNNVLGKYTYTDFIGDTFEVLISKSLWVERISSSNLNVKFFINKNEKKLIFEESNHSFFNDFYKKGEKIEIRYKQDSKGKLNVIFNLGNNIYLKKRLTRL
tara:strand:+ start:780 stop:1400 length:621 start_codon:yes stop_codon:yes gene_type:complete